MENKARVGVFFCTCHGTITQNIDYGSVAVEVKKLPEVEYVRESQHICVPLEGELMVREINKHKLDRVIVVGCSEAKREKFFTQVLEKAGINKRFLEMVNIREQCSRVHRNIDVATAKALKYTKMGIARVVKLEEVKNGVFKVNRTVLVIGGGIAGIDSALESAAKGFKVILIERQPNLGGILSKLNSIIESKSSPTDLLKEKIASVSSNPNIEVMTTTNIIDIDGNIGNFTVYLNNEGKDFAVNVGSVILATGIQTIFCPVKYGLGIADNVIGQLKLEQLLASGKDFTNKKVSFIVGKASESFNIPFVVALKNALLLKKKFNAKVSLFYTNIKVGGDEWEKLYTEAREIGINFFKFDKQISIDVNNGEITISYEDLFLSTKVPGNYKTISDYVVLPEELLPAEDSEELARILKIDVEHESFFGSNYMHLLSENSSREGIYFVGSCQSPSFISEITIQAKSVAEEILKKLGTTEELTLDLTQPYVDATKCVVCLTCYRCCPHHAITIEHSDKFENLYKSAAQMNPLACKRCGICTAECPGKAIHMPGYTDQQILAQLEAMEG